MKAAVSISRRRFLAAAAAATVALGARVPAAAQGSRRYKLIVFSKPFQDLGPEESADFIAETGFDGIECPVRPRGQVEPEAVEDDLPRYLEAFRKRNLDIPIITTHINNTGSVAAERVLRTAGRLGIRHYRMAYWRYDRSRSVDGQLESIRAQLRDLAALNKEAGVIGGYQNHSGADYVGAPVWDIHELMKGQDREHLGVHFDIGHAAIEGGYSWPTQARLMEPLLTAVYCKDFLWQQTGGAWRTRWHPFGEGMLDKRFFDWLRTTRFEGPISQHFEYPMGNRREMAGAMKRDLAVLREWLA